MRASNRVYGIPEGRPIWRTAPTRLGVTIFTVICMVAGTVIVVISGSLADKVGSALGIGSTAVTVWQIAKWPVLLLIFVLMLAVLYAASPNVRHKFRWVTPGAAVAVVAWLILSGVFAVYVANFASYNKTYGSLAGVIVFLVWLWLSNLAILFGLELDAELEHEKALHEGLPEQAEMFAIPKDTRKFDDEQTQEAEQVEQWRSPDRADR